MKAVSAKRAKQLRQYRPLADEYLKLHPFCMVGIVGCSGRSTEVHHRRGRDTAERLLNRDEWLAACHHCHVYVTEHPAESFERGWSLRRVSAS